VLLLIDNVRIMDVFEISGTSGCSLDFRHFRLSWSQFGHSDRTQKFCEIYFLSEFTAHVIQYSCWIHLTLLWVKALVGCQWQFYGDPKETLFL
jgi:hypothetical protein